MDDRGAEFLPPSDGFLADGDEVEYSSEDVDSIPPAVTNEPNDSAADFAVTTASNVKSASFSPKIQSDTPLINLRRPRPLVNRRSCKAKEDDGDNLML